MRSGDYKRMARLGTGALVLLMVHGFCAPRSAWAGCNHLVTSRLAQEQLPSLIEPLILDLAGHSNPLPVPAAPRPCLGGWCSGQPATPPVPPEVFDHGQLESWAWCRSIPGLDSVASSFISAETNSLRPVQAGERRLSPTSTRPVRLKATRTSHLCWCDSLHCDRCAPGASASDEPEPSTPSHIIKIVLLTCDDFVI